jgi:hypothetical protein
MGSKSAAKVEKKSSSKKVEKVEKAAAPVKVSTARRVFVAASRRAR